MISNHLSINSQGEILAQNNKFSIDKLQVKSEHNGRTYVTGELNGTQIEIGTLNDLVELLNSSNISNTHREILGRKIVELKAASKPIIPEHVLAPIKHKKEHHKPEVHKHAHKHGAHKAEAKPKHGAHKADAKHRHKHGAHKAEAKPPVAKPVHAPVAEKPAPKPAAANPAPAPIPAAVVKPVAAPAVANPASFNHQKTPVADLQQDKINPFRIDYGHRSSKEQCDEIVKYIKEFQKAHPGKQIALTYAANTKQANDIYAGYKKGTTPTITGSNQAEVFGLLAKEIKKNKWDKNVHILPIPTCEWKEVKGKKERVISDMKDVKKAMDNIQHHKESKNCFVLGYQNEESSSRYPLAIGGNGVAGKLWENSPQQAYVDERVHAWMASKQ